MDNPKMAPDHVRFKRAIRQIDQAANNLTDAASETGDELSRLAVRVLTQLANSLSFGRGGTFPLTKVAESFDEANTDDPTNPVGMPEQLQEHIRDWLRNNAKEPDQVRWGFFPLGMVQRWIERAELAEQKVRNLCEPANPFDHTI